MFGCFFFLVFALFLCLCVNVLYVFYLFTDFNDYNSSIGLLFFIFVLVLKKMLITFKVIVTPLQKIFGYFFQPRFCFWKFGSIKAVTQRLDFFFLFVYLLLFLHKHIKTPDHQKAIRSCSRYQFFTSDFIDTCGDIQSLIIRLTIDHCSFSMLEYQNLDSFSHCYYYFQAI